MSCAWESKDCRYDRALSATCTMAVLSAEWMQACGLDTAWKRLQIEQPGTDRQHRIWFENSRVSRPVEDDASGLADKRLFPRDCREAVRAHHNELNGMIMS